MTKTIRHLAVDILNQVQEVKLLPDFFLMSVWMQTILSGTADGRLLTHLVYGVLRLQGHLDWILAKLLPRRF